MSDTHKYMTKEQIKAIKDSIKLWEDLAHQKDAVIEVYGDLPETVLHYQKAVDARLKKTEFLYRAEVLKTLLR